MQPAPNNAASPEPPTASEIRASLERVLASRCFDQAGRSSEFLRFVVEQSLAGAADRLKGYTIAVEVFGRPADFDAQSDPLVRVEAGRLRRRLLEYYAAEGQDDPLRIELPRGGYAPEFRRQSPPALAAAPAARSGARARRLRRRIRAAIAVALVTAVVVLVASRAWYERSAVRSPSDSSLALPSGAKVLVLPFENLSGDRELDYVSDGITEEIMLRLGELHLFAIAGQSGWYSDSASGGTGLAAESGARYILTGTVRNTADGVRISARLVHASSGTQLWTEAFDEARSVATMVEIQETIARTVATTIAVPYGPIYEQELARAERKSAEHLDTYDCVLKYHYYRRAPNSKGHADALACFQSAVQREPMFADAWSGLALLYLDEHAYSYSPQPTSSTALDRGVECARTALDIDGENYLGNLALARARYFAGDLEGFKRSAERVLALGPNNAEGLAVIGTLYALSGTSPQALPLAAKALALSPRPQALYHVAQAVEELREGRYDDALSAALRIDAPNWFIAPALVAASATLAGRADVAGRAAARLRELYPAFPERAADELAKWQLDPTLRSTLERGLRAAGLEVR